MQAISRRVGEEIPPLPPPYEGGWQPERRRLRPSAILQAAVSAEPTIAPLSFPRSPGFPSFLTTLLVRWHRLFKLASIPFAAPGWFLRRVEIPRPV